MEHQEIALKLCLWRETQVPAGKSFIYYVLINNSYSLITSTNSINIKTLGPFHDSYILTTKATRLPVLLSSKREAMLWCVILRLDYVRFFPNLFYHPPRVYLSSGSSNRIKIEL